MKKNITITWANEKGGVGKTTLCTLFANYLSEKKVSDVCVLDCDRQHSIVDKRKFDSQSLQTDKVPYEVKQIEIDRLQQSAQALKVSKDCQRHLSFRLSWQYLSGGYGSSAGLQRCDCLSVSV